LHGTLDPDLLEKKTKPRSSKSLTSTIRTDGMPAPDAVASAAASGSRRPAAAASSNQTANWRRGSGSTSCSRSG
jgi:hypothetical protein